MKILVTGASGLLGTKLCEIAINKKHEVYSAYNKHKPLYGKPIQFDVSDRNAVEKAFRKIKPEAVVHAAALTNVDKCERRNKKHSKIMQKIRLLPCLHFHRLRLQRRKGNVQRNRRTSPNQLLRNH